MVSYAKGKEMTAGDEKLLLNVEEAAALIGVSTGTLYHWIGERRVPIVRLSRRCVRFRRSDLEAWLSQRTEPAQEVEDRTSRRMVDTSRGRGLKNIGDIIDTGAHNDDE